MFPFLFGLLIVELYTETQHLNLEIIVLILVILFLPFVPYLTEFEIFGAKGSFEDPEFETAKENVGEAAPPSDEGGVVPGEDEIL